MAKPTQDQIKRASDAAASSIRRIAMRIIDIPKDRREEAFKIVRRNIGDSMRDFFGRDPAAHKKFLDTYMDALQALIREIEASGGGKGGHT